MADNLGTAGKISGMTGIKDDVLTVKLLESDGSVIATASSTPTFSVSSSGQLSNTSAIDFTIGSEDITDPEKVAYKVQLLDSSSDELITIDLETSVTLTTEGTATISIGDLTADL